MSHFNNLASGNNTPQHFNIGAADAVPVLRQGNMNADGQQRLAAVLTTSQNQLNSLPLGLLSPAHLTGDGMELDDPAFADSSASGSFAAVLKKRSGGTLQVLPCTKAMKNKVRNTMDKLGRLRLKLVSFGQADTLEKRKKYFQFRLVGVDSIGADVKNTLDTAVAKEVLDALVNNTKAEIKRLEDVLPKFGTQLRTELEKLQELATIDFLPSDGDVALSEDQKMVLSLWERTITYNVRWFGEELAKMQAGLLSKVMSRVNSIHVLLIRAKLEELIDSILDVLINLPNSTIEESSFHANGSGSGGAEAPQPQYRKEKTRSAKHHQKRLQQKEAAHLQEGHQQTSLSSLNQGKEGQRFEKRKGTGERKLTGTERTRSRKTRPRFSHLKLNQKTQILSGPLPVQRTSQVFVNVFTENNICIPSHVFRMLNLGANYQLASLPSLKQLKGGWQTTSKIARRTLDSSGILFNNKEFSLIERAISHACLGNNKFLNKIFQGRQFRSICKHNKLIESVYNFIVSNDLLVILADKNLGLTIVDKSWYDINMRTHFNRSELFEHVPVPSPGDLEHEQAKLQMMLSNKIHFKVMVLETVATLVPRNVTRLQVPQAYGLIKLHKNP